MLRCGARILAETGGGRVGRMFGAPPGLPNGGIPAESGNATDTPKIRR